LVFVPPDATDRDYGGEMAMIPKTKWGAELWRTAKTISPFEEMREGL
jgi:hypothetical protein